MIKDLVLSIADTYDARSLCAALAAVVLSTLILKNIVYPLYFHPLAKIPGPTICALTGYYILYKTWNEERNRYVQELHEKYGSIVRIGPNEVDINDVTYMRDIYIGDFDKTSFYTQFVNYGMPNTFSTTGKKDHTQSRKVSHKFYSKTNICSDNIMPKIEKVMSDTLAAFDKYNGKSINVFILFCDMAMDAVTSFSFGLDNYKSLLSDPFGHGNTIVSDFGLQSSTWFWVTHMPSFYDMVVSRKVVEASQRCYDWIEKQFDYSIDRLSRSREKKEDTLLSVYFESSPDSGKARQKNQIFDNLKTKSEFFDHIAAGHVTTGTTLSYLFFELGKHPEMQEKLRSELMGKLNDGKPVESSNHVPFKYSLIDNDELLPYMHAVILETFRVHAAIPGEEPRVVPAKGMIFRGNDTVSACKIPGGTTVVMQPWSLHRVSTLFPDPDRFDPERWLDASPEQLKQMKGNLMHFGSGARMCIGMNLATAEIKIIVASLMARYNVGLVEDFDYEVDGEMLDIYTTLPRSEKMMLRFKPL